MDIQLWTSGFRGPAKQNLIVYSIFLLNYSYILAQEVPILNYSVDVNDRVSIEVSSSTDKYYVLNTRFNESEDFNFVSSIHLGEEGTTILREPLGSYPLEHYQVLEYPIDNPVDTDGDGVNDIEEYLGMPVLGPLNAAAPILEDNGSVAISSLEGFEELSVLGAGIPWADFLNGKLFVKFVIDDFTTESPKFYFINSKQYAVHSLFMSDHDIDNFGDVVKGEIIYHPNLLNLHGEVGLFTFNYSIGEGKEFEIVRRTCEIMAANMPFLENNLSYYITEMSLEQFEEDEELFISSRVNFVFEEEILGNLGYLALNSAEGYGRLRVMDLNETPGARDIVLYDALPNTLPRVGGIISSFFQTPLSHVNLRAIQDRVPNAFIRNPLNIPLIENLVGENIYFKVEPDGFEIREATQMEVDAWFDALRPKEEQFPPLDLSYTDIMDLDDIRFDMADGFGAKCANLATMRGFGFEETVIPDGYGVPFYFYQEFMEYNGLHEAAEQMIAEEDFQASLELREERLSDFRKRIRDAEMPDWMLEDLAEMHALFPEGTSVRCRSSTNNEDLPGFSGAGLYTSKTQHPDEGHISKSIKQVYAGMWNLRAFEERDFYRINHRLASMGVLCHPNFEDEISNGVAISLDPIYQIENAFYINTQVGEDLVTNPEEFSIPEEMLVAQDEGDLQDLTIVRQSNLTDMAPILNLFNLLDLISYLHIIHEEFKALYQVDPADEARFAMDIEFKERADGTLAIKQARPWAGFWSSADITDGTKEISLAESAVFPNPVTSALQLNCDCGFQTIRIVNLIGQEQSVIHYSQEFEHTELQLQDLQSGWYGIQGFNEAGQLVFVNSFVKANFF